MHCGAACPDVRLSGLLTKDHFDMRHPAFACLSVALALAAIAPQASAQEQLLDDPQTIRKPADFVLPASRKARIDRLLKDLGSRDRFTRTYAEETLLRLGASAAGPVSQVARS